MSDKADVAVSYDVDNEFFRLWLDRRMNYTGAVFEDTDDLEAAQLAKLAVLYRFGGVSATSRVLDICCGWAPTSSTWPSTAASARSTASRFPRHSTRRSAGGCSPSR